MRYYVHASTHAAKANQEYLRDVPKSTTGWWAAVIVLTILVVVAIWLVGR